MKSREFSCSGIEQSPSAEATMAGCEGGFGNLAVTGCPPEGRSIQ